MRPPTLLVTGFSGFGEHTLNPAAELAALVDGTRVHGVAVRGVVVPVTWAGAFPAIRAAVDATRPAALLMLGVAGRPAFNYEVVAHNRQGAKPDADGHLPPGNEVVAGGPARLASRLPWSLLSTGTAPVVYSNDAGDYLCNHVFYRALSELDRIALRGFVHLPPLPESGLSCAMPWASLAEAGQTLITSLAAVLASIPDSRPPNGVPRDAA